MDARFELDDSALMDAIRRLGDRAGDVCAGAVNEAIIHGQALIIEATPLGEYTTPDTGKAGTGIRRGGRAKGSIDIDLATPESPAGRIFTTVEYFPAIEWGTGVHSDMPGAPRQPITIRAKNPRTITYRRNGKTVTVTITALTWYGQIHGEPDGSNGWTSRKQVTIQGMTPRAPFRNNLPLIQQRLNEALRRRYQAALEGR